MKAITVLIYRNIKGDNRLSLGLQPLTTRNAIIILFFSVQFRNCIYCIGNFFFYFLWHFILIKYVFSHRLSYFTLFHYCLGMLCKTGFTNSSNIIHRQTNKRKITHRFTFCILKQLLPSYEVNIRGMTTFDVHLI
jgi:hypothetical protein